MDDVKVEEKLKLCLELQQFDMELQNVYRAHDTSGRVAAFAQTTPMSSEEKEERLADIEEFLMEEGFPPGDTEREPLLQCNLTLQSPPPPPSGGNLFAHCSTNEPENDNEYDGMVMSPQTQGFFEADKIKTFGRMTMEEEADIFSQPENFNDADDGMLTPPPSSGNPSQVSPCSVYGKAPALSPPEIQLDAMSTPEKTPDAKEKASDADVQNTERPVAQMPVANTESPSPLYTVNTWWAGRVAEKLRKKKRKSKEKGPRNTVAKTGPQAHFGRLPGVSVVQQKKIEKPKRSLSRTSLPQATASTSKEGVLTRRAAERNRWLKKIISCYVPLVKLSWPLAPMKNRGRGRPRKNKELLSSTCNFAKREMRSIEKRKVRAQLKAK